MFDEATASSKIYIAIIQQNDYVGKIIIVAADKADMN